MLLHGGHVGGQEQKHFSPLAAKLCFRVNSSRKNSIVLTPNMAALSRGCIRSGDLSGQSSLFPLPEAPFPTGIRRAEEIQGKEARVC